MPSRFGRVPAAPTPPMRQRTARSRPTSTQAPQAREFGFVGDLEFFFVGDLEVDQVRLGAVFEPVRRVLGVGLDSRFLNTAPWLYLNEYGTTLRPSSLLSSA